MKEKNVYVKNELQRKTYVFCESEERKFKKLKSIKLAQCAGFCYGVKRAVETTRKIKKDNPSKNVWVLGELIHNSHVINGLEKSGIKTVDDLPENETGICIIRTHGTAPEKIEEIKDNGFEVVDLTCLDVKKVQQKAIQLADEGYLVLILGKPEHPEVIGIKANAKRCSDNVFVISDISELREISEEINKTKKVGVVVQTTQKQELLQSVVSELIPLTKELKIYNTICKSTSRRQSEARELAENSDLMIVVGGKNSANTTHLAEILKEITLTLHIESASDLNNFSEVIRKSQNIGVTAGASTPDELINDVINYLKNI